MKYESLILDIDGTLWDSRALVAEGYNIQLRREGLDHLCITADDLLPLFGKVMPAIFDVILATIPVPERYAMMDRCIACENEYLENHPCQIAYPGVQETIPELAKKYRLFIVSNSQSGYPALCAEKLGLTPYISGHLCFGDTNKTKGENIRILMERHGIENAAYVGDTQGDYEAAQAAGVDFIWCSYGFEVPKGYAAKVDSFPELLEL